MGKIIDISGQRFGKLVALKRVDDKNKAVMFLCKCDCGGIKEFRSHSLRTGIRSDCGCIDRKTTHGMTKSRIYKVWSTMKARCNRKDATSYEQYGGRGIKVCKEWIESFEKFRDWAYDNGYDDTLTIDRIDVNGNYEPFNCRWLTLQEQSNNKRTNVFVEINGETLNLAQVCAKYNIGRGCINRRYKNGLRGNDLIKPIDKKKSHPKKVV